MIDKVLDYFSSPEGQKMIKNHNKKEKIRKTKKKIKQTIKFILINIITPIIVTLITTLIIQGD